MYYNIGEVAKKFNLTISTLRYYDSEGLFPDLQRNNGIRKFCENEIEALRVMECLKKSGLEIKDIKKFLDLCKEGPKTYQERKELFLKQKAQVDEEIKKLEKTKAMLEFKCWYYETALKEGSEDKIKALIPDGLPKEIKKLYLKCHQDQAYRKINASKKFVLEATTRLKRDVASKGVDEHIRCFLLSYYKDR